MVCLHSCNANDEADVPSASEMEEILLDYHLAARLAEVRASSEGLDSEEQEKLLRQYAEAACEKHGMTPEQLDAAMAYYVRHSDKLYKIYTNIGERLAAYGGVSASAAQSANVDTTNIYAGVPSVLLSNVGRNFFAFEMPADTLIHSNDKLELRFSANWNYREGSKNGVALMSVTYENDSMQTQSVSLFRNTDYHVTLRVGALPVKKLAFFVYQQSAWSDSPKFLSISNISLTRTPGESVKSVGFEGNSLPSEAPIEMPNMRADAEKTLRDSLLRADSLKRVETHFK